MADDISAKSVKIQVVGTVNKVPRPMQFTIDALTTDGDILSADAMETMATAMTADGKLLRYAVPGTLDITLNLAPNSSQNLHFSQVLQEQAGYGNLYLATEWVFTIEYPGMHVIMQEGTLISGNVFPNIGYDRLQNLTFTFTFPKQRIKILPI